MSLLFHPFPWPPPLTAVLNFQVPMADGCGYQFFPHIPETHSQGTLTSATMGAVSLVLQPHHGRQAP